MPPLEEELGVARTYLAIERMRNQTLGGLEASLDPSVFVRVHRSYLVRLDRIRALEPSGKNDHIALLADGTRVPVSREGYARLKELLA